MKCFVVDEWKLLRDKLAHSLKRYTTFEVKVTTDYKSRLTVNVDGFPGGAHFLVFVNDENEMRKLFPGMSEDFIQHMIQRLPCLVQYTEYRKTLVHLVPDKDLDCVELAMWWFVKNSTEQECGEDNA